MKEQEILEFNFESYGSEQYLDGPIYTAGDLAAPLEAVADGVELAWMYTQGVYHKTHNGHWIINPGLCGRSGWFYPVKETFVDAFDRTTYEMAVWKYSASAGHPGSIRALELNSRDSTNTSQNGCLLRTAGDLKRLLGTVDPGTRLLAPSRNFELQGALVDDNIFMYLGKDIQDREYLFLALD
ncbi:MAG: hypothetical protein LUF00_07735 [Lachnospiraceae bacterium]|nr:hypothetical protein [Lachnospiraceae bacterium]